MSSTTLNIFGRQNIKIAALDLSVFLAIFLLPSFAHLTGVPFYLMEPMRIAIFVLYFFSNKSNTLIIAVTLPFFSFLISGHPVLIKAALIGSEFLLNILVLDFLFKKQINNFAAIGLSIIASKLIYYFLKFILIKTALMEGNLFSTPFIPQLLVIGLFSLVFFFVAKKRQSKL